MMSIFSSVYNFLPDIGKKENGWYLYFNLNNLYKPGDKDSQYRKVLGKMENVLKAQEQVNNKFKQAKNMPNCKPTKIVVPKLASDGNNILCSMLDMHSRMKQEYTLAREIVTAKTKKSKSENDSKYQKMLKGYEGTRRQIKRQLEAEYELE